MGEMAEMYWEYCDPFDLDKPSVTCKRCGASDLYWQQEVIDLRWVLVDIDGNVHQCNPIKLYREKFG